MGGVIFRATHVHAQSPPRPSPAPLTSSTQARAHWLPALPCPPGCGGVLMFMLGHVTVLTSSCDVGLVLAPPSPIQILGMLLIKCVSVYVCGRGGGRGGGGYSIVAVVVEKKKCFLPEMSFKGKCVWGGKSLLPPASLPPASQAGNTHKHARTHTLTHAYTRMDPCCVKRREE